ncbi:hypothetical protein ACHWQZ_G017073 [Mnemiopsis leidyi]
METSGHNDFLAGEVDEYKMRVDDDVGDGCLADSDEGVRGLRLYPQVLVGWGINLVAYSIIYTWSFEWKKERLQTYIVSTLTGTISDGGSSSIGLSVILEGDNSYLGYTSFLEPTGGSFEEGALDKSVLRNMPELGRVKCITLEVADTNAWYSDFVVREEGEKGELFGNVHPRFPSADGMWSMKICV